MYIEFNLVIFVDTLTTMSNRIRKQRKSSSVFKRAFLSRVIVRSKEMSIYKNCFKYNLRSYTVSPLDSIRSIKYIRSNRSKYDILGPIAIQLKALSSIYVRLEAELEDIFKKQMQESLCIVRLQA